MEIKPREADWAGVSANYRVAVEPHEAALAADVRAILARRGIEPGATLLEAGCGSGHLSLELRRAGYRTDLLDFDAASLAKARQGFEAEPASLDGTGFILGDLLKLDESVQPGSYDVVWNSGVLEHFSAETLERALRQMGRAARRAVLVIVPNPASVIYLAYREAMLQQQRWDVGVEMLREDYEDRARASGLRLLERGYCGKAYTHLFLGQAVTAKADQERFARLIDSGTTPAETLYLQYLVFAPTGAPAPKTRSRPRDPEPMLDKTFYLDALGAANAAAARLARSLDKAEGERDRLQNELLKRGTDQTAAAARSAELEKAVRAELAEVRAALAQARQESAAVRAALEQAARAVQTGAAALLREQVEKIGSAVEAQVKPLRDAADALAQHDRLILRHAEDSARIARLHGERFDRAERERVRLLEQVEQARADLGRTLAAAEEDRRDLRQRLDRLARMGSDAMRTTRELAAARAELERVRREHSEVREQLAAAQADRDRLKGEADALVPRLDAAAAHARRAVDTLEAFKSHRGFRVAHYLNLAVRRFLLAPGEVRREFVRRAWGRIARGRRGAFSDWNALNIPQGEVRQGLGLVERVLAAARTPVSTDRGTPDGGVVIPPAVAVRVPEPATRRPHGQRRVAYLTNMLLDWHDQRPRFGGGERYAWTLAQLMRDLGLSVHFFQGAHSAFEAHYYGFPVTGVPGGAWFSEFNHGMTRRFEELARDYDHVVYNLPEYAGGPVREDGLLICHGIWFDHNNYYPVSRFRTAEWYRLLGRAFAGPRRIVSVDTNSINVIRTIWPELGGKMTYIPNFYNAQDFYPAARAENDPLMVLFPRRSQRNRGSRILAEILARVPHDVRFCWVGEGDREDMELILDLAKRDPRLTFHRADFHEMPEWYRAADIAVIPTIACEGTSLSLLEALACGVPTITTNVGGLPDLVHYGNNGIIVDPTPEALADAINTLIESPAERARLRRTAVDSVRPFELENWRRAWTRVLRELDWVPADAAARPPQPSEPAREGDRTEGAAARRAARRDRDRPRVAIVTRHATHGGVESIVAAQSALLSAPVIVTGGMDAPETCPFAYTRADNYDDLVAALREFDAVVYHWLFDWGVQAVRDSGLPCIEFVHRADTCDNDKSVPTAIVTHSAFLAEHIRALWGRDCAVVAHPIDAQRFAPPAELGCHVGGVTSYSPAKGLDLFIEAWAKVAPHHPGLRARFYGSGPDQKELERQATAAGVTVEFLGPRADPAAVYPEFRLLVCPSRVEGFPMVIAEAAAMNIPIVAADLPGIAEFNRVAEFNGFPAPVVLFRAGDAGDLARALHEALNAADRPDTRPYIRTYFDPAVHLRRMRDIIAGAMIRGRQVERSLRTEASWTDAALVSEDGRFRIQHVRAKEDGSAEIRTPTSPGEHRRARFDQMWFPGFVLDLVPGVEAVSARVVPEGDGAVTWQVDWLGADDRHLGTRFGPLLLFAGRDAIVRAEPVPEGAARARLTLRPLPREIVRLREVRLWTSTANEPTPPVPCIAADVARRVTAGV